MTSITTEAPAETTAEATEEPKAGMVEVPNISGKTLEEAQEILEEKKLKWRLNRWSQMRHQIRS